MLFYVAVLLFAIVVPVATSPGITSLSACKLSTDKNGAFLDCTRSLNDLPLLVYCCDETGGFTERDFGLKSFMVVV